MAFQTLNGVRIRVYTREEMGKRWDAWGKGWAVVESLVMVSGQG